MSWPRFPAGSAPTASQSYVTQHLSSGVVRRPVPNYVYYPGVLVGWFRKILPPFISILGLAEAWRRRHEAVGRFFAVLAAGTLAVYLPYFFRNSLFMAPVGILELALAGAMCGRLIDSWRRPPTLDVERASEAVADATGSSVGSNCAEPASVTVDRLRREP